MKLNRLRGLPILAVLSILVACGGADREAVEQSIIRIDGSSTVFPITEAVAEDFQRQHPDTRVTVGISGTGGGFQKFCRGETDISDASRPIKASEIEQCRASGVEFIELPVAYDGIAIVVNPQNTWAEWISVEELKTLWEPAAQGQVMRWNQVRPDWPDREIHLFGPGVDSGTFDYFTEAVAGQEEASRGDFTSSEDDNVLVQGVATDELALGYFGYAYFEENQGKLKLVPVAAGPDASRATAVAPSPETIRTGTYTPLSRPLFIYVRREATERPEVQAFVDYYLSEAQELVREVGYVPLTDRIYEFAQQRFQNRTTGTMFADASQTQALDELMTAPPAR